MADATLSSKNQVVIPREARKALGIKAGDKLLFVVLGKRVVGRRLGLPDASVQVLQGIIFVFVLASDALYGRIGFLKGKS